MCINAIELLLADQHLTGVNDTSFLPTYLPTYLGKVLCLQQFYRTTTHPVLLYRLNCAVTLF